MSLSHETTPLELIPLAMRAMRANRVHVRGGPEQLVFEEAPIPSVAPGDALVEVRAAGVTPSDLTWTFRERLGGTSRAPLIPGHEVAGIVVGAAQDVLGLTIGEAVYALVPFDRDGAAAEYVAVPAQDLATKPRSLSFAQAAATPLAALTAWQALITHAHLRANQRVLIHGAVGAVGTFAVQIARLRGAHVIGIASARDAALLAELGCDEVIDDQRTRFEEAVHDVDIVFDMVGGDTTARSWAVLRPGGVLVTSAAPTSRNWADGRAARGLFFDVQPHRLQLREIARLIDDGVIRPIFVELLPLELGREANMRGLRGHPHDKLVLSVGEAN